MVAASIISFPLVILLLSSGCATRAETAGLVAGVTVAGSRSPSQEIEQVYYLGIFDPQEQVPPSVYRVTVHGQASFIGLTKFASGWVPAETVDSLNTSIGYGTNGKVEFITQDTNRTATVFEPGRRMISFGPEGFREAPKNHRLVIVMGSNPSRYFEAVNSAFGKTVDAAQNKRFQEQLQAILQVSAQTTAEKERLQDLMDGFSRPRP